jgi:hypothetical protein
MATMANQGLEQIARLISGATTSSLWWDYMALGCGSVAEDAAHTKLHQEITNFGGRKAATNYYSGSGGYFSKWQCSWGFSGATTIWEIGVFNKTGINSSTMLFRHKLGSSRVVGAGDSLSVTLSCEFTV